MPWVALAPRAWSAPRPRLRLVKAAPKNPYEGLSAAQLQQIHTGLTQAILHPLASSSLAQYTSELVLLEHQMAIYGVAVPAPPMLTPSPPPTPPAAPNPYASLSPMHLAQAHQGLLADIADPQYAQHVPSLQQQVTLVEQQMLATGLMQPPPVLSSVQQWEKLMDLAQAAAPKMQQALTDAFDWPKLPSGVQQSLVQGQVAQALGQMADFGMQQMEASYVPAFSELAEQMFTEVAAAQWPALRQTLLQTGIPTELPTKLPDDIMVQRALRYVRTEGLTRAKNLWIPTIEASREIIRVGLAEGKTTQKIAQELRQHIGLLPGQGKQLMAYNQGLMESGTPPAKVDTLTDKFAAKLLRRRTTVIARTETAAALNVAADTFFEAAKDAANLPETALRRFWLITFDGRTCPICRAIPEMNEDGHLFQEPFMTPSGPHMRPPAHPQCRCVVIVRPTIIAAPGFTPQATVPAPPVLPAPVAFPTPPPKAKKPAKPKKPKAAPVPPAPVASEQYTTATPAPAWATDPPHEFWLKTKDVDVGTPAFPPGKMSTGVVMIEDGKIWVYEPKNHFGGYTTGFPKGTVEPHLSGQQNALKEVFEETGLHAKITGFLGDFGATTGTTRLYLGEKIGGNPTKFGDETWSVKLLTPADLEKELVAQGQSYPLAALQALKDKGLIPATPAVAIPPLVTYAPTPQVSGTMPLPAFPLAPPLTAPAVPVAPPTTAPAKPAPAPRAKPLKATEQIELATAKGELIRDLGGSTGAQQYRGTDGVERAVKGPKTQQAYQEFVANKLYRELGVEAPDQKLVMDQGKIAGVASTWEAGTQTLERAGLTQERARGVLKGFVADVWLANRDAVGLTMDNILVKGDRLIRIDNGGSLMFRAQGSLKNKDDLGKLGEWQGLQSRSLNRAYADVFQASGYGTPENIPDLVDQVKALQALRDRTNGFSDLVPAAPGVSAAQRKEVVQLLQKRARLLEEQVGLVAPKPARDIAAEIAATKRYLGESRYNSLLSAVRREGTIPVAMHEHEAVAIWDYTGSAYRSMNEPFWTDRDAATRARERSERAPIIDPAMAGLEKLDPGKEGTYYRGVRELSQAYIARMDQVGTIVELEGFASTSSKKQVAVQRFHGDKHLFVIKGKGGNYNVMPISQLGTSEAEYLYPPSARFRVVGPMTEDPLTRAKVFHLEEVPDVQKRIPTHKAQEDESYPQPDPWPEDYDIWTDAQKHAWALGLLAELEAHVYTPEELAAAEHFSAKQESAHTVPQEPMP